LLGKLSKLFSGVGKYLISKNLLIWEAAQVSRQKAETLAKENEFRFSRSFCFPFRLLISFWSQ
jgi:hypothetical protein